MWLRQLEWHAALYRAAPTALEDQVPLAPSSNTGLDAAERLAKYLLAEYRGWTELEKFAVARTVRNKFTATDVKQCFELLKEKNIVELQILQRTRGPAQLSIRKRSWEQITSDESGVARTFLKKLRVNRDAFE